MLRSFKENALKHNLNDQAESGVEARVMLVVASPSTPLKLGKLFTRLH
jgi:hypothetical protein